MATKNDGGDAPKRGGISALGALRITNEREWYEVICSAFHEDGLTTLAEAAAILGVSKRNLTRWVNLRDARGNLIFGTLARRLEGKPRDESRLRAACPKCGARSGVDCVSKNGKINSHPHTVRSAAPARAPRKV